MNCFEEPSFHVRIKDGHLKVTRKDWQNIKVIRLPLLKERNYNVTLQIGPEKRCLQCHKEVLKSDIPYFKAMFSDNFQESSQSQVELGEYVDFQTVSKLVDFCYKGVLDVSSSEVPNMFQAADLWGLSQLKESCACFMVQQLDASNCLGLLQLAQMHSCTLLVNPCLQLISEQFLAVSQSEAFLQLSATVLSTILSIDTLNTGVQGEEAVLQAVLCWSRHNPDVDKSQFAEVLDKVRVSCIPKETRDSWLSRLSSLDEVHRRLCRNKVQPPRCHKQQFFVICGFPQSRTGPRCPRISSTERYDPETSTFQRIASLPDAPSYGVAFTLLGRVVYVAVFTRTDQEKIKITHEHACYFYNTLLNSWILTEDFFSKPALDTVQQCLVSGGSIVHCARKNRIYTLSVQSAVCIEVQCQDGELYCDIEKSLPSLSSHLDASHIGLKGVSHNGQLYVMGGMYGPEMERICSGHVLALSDDDTKWEARAKMVTPRIDFAVVSYGNRLFVMGGYGGGGQRRRLQSCEHYFVEADEWQPFAPLRQSRSHFCAVVANHKIYAIGGKSYSSEKSPQTVEPACVPGGARIVLNTVEEVLPGNEELPGSASAVWTRLSDLCSGRCTFAATVL